MDVDLIIPPRKGLAKGEYESLLISEETNVIQAEPKQVSGLISKLDYIRFVRSKLGSGVKHITDDGLGYLLYFIPTEKSIVTCHGINIPYLDYFSARTKLIYGFCLKCMSRATRVHAVSNWAKRDILTYTKVPADRIDVVRFGLNSKIFRPRNGSYIRDTFGIPEKNKIVLYVGSEQPRKNVPTLIEAFYRLKKKMPNVTLVKVGTDGWPGMRERVLKQIESLGLQKDVIFAGWYPNNELPKLYNSADVFVFPSYSEGFGVPPLEALACGLPVITTDKTSLPEIVGDAAIKLSDPFDSKLLADAMEKVLTNNGLKQDMIKKGLKQAKEFTWEKYTKGVYKIYEEVWNSK
ncbi:D-inositol-3-phosphate glycosyltransferase [uncultured archaeon]|nr:D-inositol-3-phosphate glycosyltransferase [uncultured archaeon]